jgi:hypothetical protein
MATDLTERKWSHERRAHDTLARFEVGLGVGLRGHAQTLRPKLQPRDRQAPVQGDSGCGVGQIDSNGGADYTVTEVGDTSDASQLCDLPQTCLVGEDDALRVDITIGDGVADTCSSGTANAFAAVPVLTTTWVEHSSGDTCPAADGTFDPDAGDQLLVSFPQVLDFTTDTNTVRWDDLDGDGCVIAGVGPQIGFSSAGSCLDFETKTLVTAASGPIGSSVSVADISFSTVLPNVFSGPRAPLGATCGNPPLIDVGGIAHRCIGR